MRGTRSIVALGLVAVLGLASLVGAAVFFGGKQQREETRKREAERAIRVVE